MTPVVTNYDGGIVATPQVLATPETVADLQGIMRDRERYPAPVRPMGSYHSLTPCVSSPGTIVSMAKMNRVIHVDSEDMTLTAMAGMQHIRAGGSIKK